MMMTTMVLVVVVLSTSLLLLYKYDNDTYAEWRWPACWLYQEWRWWLWWGRRCCNFLLLLMLMRRSKSTRSRSSSSSRKTKTMTIMMKVMRLNTYWVGTMYPPPLQHQVYQSRHSLFGLVVVNKLHQQNTQWFHCSLHEEQGNERPWKVSHVYNTLSVLMWIVASWPNTEVAVVEWLSTHVRNEKKISLIIHATLYLTVYPNLPRHTIQAHPWSTGTLVCMMLPLLTTYCSNQSVLFVLCLIRENSATNELSLCSYHVIIWNLKYVLA